MNATTSGHMVPVPESPRRPRRARAPFAWSALATVAVLAAAACSGGSDTSLALSPQAEEGRRLYNASGCSGCHGSEGQGGVAPRLAGLPGTEVELADGQVVIADDAYLTRSIMDPDADIVAGYSIRMPSNRLSEDEVAKVVAYIKELDPDS